MKIAIDFDGVIHEYSKGWTTGQIYDPPVKGAREALQQLKARGHTIYLFTTRTNSMFRKKDEPDQKLMIEAWMKQHDIPYDKIWTFGKPMADIFIDDRALHFRGDWNETLEQVEVFKVWNKQD
jgi:ribonucleotide monophosphatase NagD (HAD superfamily)